MYKLLFNHFDLKQVLFIYFRFETCLFVYIVIGIPCVFGLGGATLIRFSAYVVLPPSL